MVGEESKERCNVENEREGLKERLRTKLKRRGRFEGEIEVREEGEELKERLKKRLGFLHTYEERWLAKFLVSEPDVISKQT